MRQSHRFHGGRVHGLPVAGNELPATALRDGELARVVRIAGGERLAARLHNLGVLPGKRVVKLGTMPGRGPVMLDCDGVRVALGRGIASHVIVERVEPASTEESA